MVVNMEDMNKLGGDWELDGRKLGLWWSPCRTTEVQPGWDVQRLVTSFSPSEEGVSLTTSSELCPKGATISWEKAASEKKDPCAAIEKEHPGPEIAENRSEWHFLNKICESWEDRKEVPALTEQCSDKRW